MGDLQRIGAQALNSAPQPLRRALDGLGVQFRGENGPTAPMAGGLGPGGKSMLAGVEQGNPNTISVMDPGAFRNHADQIATHEGTHVWQNNLPPAIQKAIPPDNPNDPYNYGGTQGIKSLLAQGKGLANMPREQAAAAMQYGEVNGMPAPYKSLAQTMNNVPLSQVDMTDPNAKAINMHPRAPQVPPNTVPGMNFAKEIYQPGQPAPGDMPDLGAAPLPNVQLAMPSLDATPDAPVLPDSQPMVRTLNPLERNIDEQQKQLQKVRYAQANPWGSANNHPGTMGKIAHVLSVAGNIAGNIVAPNVMANIPGTELNQQVQGNQLTGELNKEQQELSENNSRDAVTGKTQEETAEAPQKAADTHSLIDSTVAKNNAEAQPKPVDLAHAYSVAVQRAIASGQDPMKDPVVQHISDAITSIQKQPTQAKPDTPEQQYLDEYQKTHPGASIADAEKHFAVDTQRPQQPPQVMVMIPNASGGSTATVLHPGSTVAPGTTTMSGFNSESVSGDKADQAAQKAREDAGKEYQLAQSLVQHPSPTNDLALVMRYVGATKPDSMGKLRLNQNEISLVMGTRSSLGDLQALAQKVENGQMLTPRQRGDMLSTMKLLTGQNEGEAAGTGMMFARDPSGKLHQAPTGTALPPGWKEGR